ncbi:MAG: hypothetical protein Q8Q09_17160 [Deltaproteobacteria bacterium]|nr:hypothetical protein [Deltaproteobacteria bacterium]
MCRVEQTPAHAFFNDTQPEVYSRVDPIEGLSLIAFQEQISNHFVVLYIGQRSKGGGHGKRRCRRKWA